MNRFVFNLILIAGLAAVQSLAEAKTDPELAKAAYAILKQKCYRCHGIDKQVEGMDVLVRDTLVSTGYIVPGKPDDSELWTRVGVLKDMPKKPDTLSDEQIATIRQWIEAGADFPELEKKKSEPLDELYILTHIEDHARKQDVNAKHFRYFSLAHIYNDSDMTDDNLRLYRAALSKVINSMHRKAQIVLPQAVDPNAVVFALDLRSVGWEDPAIWLQVLQKYPYGITFNDIAVQQRTDSVNTMLGGGNRLRNLFPYVRADWFITTASRPPLYDVLLKLPATDADLEKELGFSAQSDFTSNNMLRAGFTESGVSRSNRLIDRHIGSFGYFYRSHDFGRNSGKAILARFPLGPKSFAGTDFADFAYEQDGGEIVFRLPNGLQGYMIVDKDGKKIPDAPVSVVRDLSEIAGSPAVVNGISCMVCHREGVKSFVDNVRASVVLSGAVGQKVAQLYRPSDLPGTIENDSRSFQQALEAAMGPFLRLPGENPRDKDIVKDFPEAIDHVARQHQAGVSVSQAARELGVPTESLQGSLKLVQLQQLGLGPLGLPGSTGKGNRIPRQMWESKEDNGSSVFQVVATELNIGVARNIPDSN
jgi:serine/threonine-protein kinase